MSNTNNDEPNQEALSPNERLSSIQAQTLIALHDVVGMVDKNTENTTYQDIMDLANRLAPNFFGRLNLLRKSNESELAIQYRQQADMESLEKKEKVLPIDVAKREKARWRTYLNRQDIDDRDAVIKRLRKIESVIEELEPRLYTENRLLVSRDMLVGNDLDYVSKGGHYLDIALPQNRILRLRLIHPDAPEDITGIDVLYEHHNVPLKKARIVASQYKVWEKQTLYTSQSNVEDQLEKLKCVFCDGDLCKEDSNDTDRHLYRLRYCSAFLRPTNKVQNPDTRLVSIGYHIPICRVDKLWEATNKGKKLTYESIRNESLTQRAFEELFWGAPQFFATGTSNQKEGGKIHLLGREEGETRWTTSLCNR